MSYSPFAEETRIPTFVFSTPQTATAVVTGEVTDTTMVTATVTEMATVKETVVNRNDNDGG